MKKRELTANEFNSILKEKMTEAKKTNLKQTIMLGNKLYCVVLPSGRCTFSVRTTIKQKDTRETLGYYGELTLATARKKANEVLNKLNYSSISINNAEIPLFGDYSATWKETKRANPDIENGHKNNDRYDTVKSLLKHLKDLNNYPLNEITPKIVDQVLSKLTKLTQGTKHRSIEILNECLNSAEVEGLIEVNHCKNMLNSTSALSIKYRAPKVKGYKWVKPELLKVEFFEKIEECGKLKYKYFWLVLAFTGLRVGSLRHCKWEWIDYEHRVIHIPGQYMKMGRDFDCTITIFIETLLKNWKKYCEDNCCLSKYVFFADSTINEPISEAGLQDYIRNNTTMHMHGIRKSLGTWFAEMGISKEVKEAVLAHKKEGALEEVYNKYEYFPQKLSALRLWGYFIYAYQLTESLRKMLHGINLETLKIYKGDYEHFTQQIEHAKNNLY